MEGLKKAMEYLVEQSQPNFKEYEGILFSDKNMYRVHQEDPVAAPIVLSTLSSLVDYIKSNTDKMREKMLIHVEGPDKVSLLSMLDDDRIREELATVKARIPDFNYGYFYGSEEFTIKLQAQFMDHGTDPNKQDLPFDTDTDKEKLLRYTGTVQAGTVKDYGDDGVSQSAVIQQSLTSKDEAVIPNPVTLRPYRTFIEVEQPKSKFIFRAHDHGEDVAFALFEADGGVWKNIAMASIKEYLIDRLVDVDIPNVMFTVIS